MKNLLDRFLGYVRIDTQSDENSDSCPSTDKQFVFAEMLAGELKDLGISQVDVSEKGYVMACLPSNVQANVPAVGFIAHMDTSPEMKSVEVNPVIIENYDGREIILNREENIVLSPSEFPELRKYIGQTIITTDGKTMLGADDKAGIAEIITALEYLLGHPEIKRGEIKVCFTPDEEISRGTDHFDLTRFNVAFAYTVDGGELGELEYENFNGALASVIINGRNIHPGTAKDKMLNSVLVAMEFNTMLPPKERPEHTEFYEGFYHLVDFTGNVETTKLRYLIRDHDRDLFETRKTMLRNIASSLNMKYGNDVVKVAIKDQYYNMKEKFANNMHVVELARRAMITAGVTPVIKPVRGGTDGARLSYLGLLTPNIFTGGHNFHGKFEYIPLESMIMAVHTIIKIAELNYLDASGK